MSLAMIDAREWQRTFDLRTGEPLKRQNDVVKMVSETLSHHPYPGDVDQLSNQWVSDTALDLIDKYDPGLVCLNYSHQYFTNRHIKMSETDRRKMYAFVFAEAERFIESSGFTPVIVGTGDMTPLKGEINLSRLDGLAVSGTWSARYVGLHSPSEDDMDFLKTISEIEAIVGKEEWLSLFDNVRDRDYDERLLPDYLVLAKEGWSFRTFGIPLRRPVMILANNFNVPVYTPFGSVLELTDIHDLIKQNLGKQKIALIILEGVGAADFSGPFALCDNSKGWYYYESGECQYLTITTGRHQALTYPAGFRYFDQDDEKKEFPFSGYFTEIPKHTIGGKYSGKSIAVGNHSMFMHMAFGVDISVECFARNLYNQGCLAVIHDDTKM